MNEYQLFFNEASQVQQFDERWQATYSLTVQDMMENRNTFQICVSGKTQESVQEFVVAQKSKCTIRPEVLHPPLSDQDETIVEGMVRSFTFGPPETPLTISILPLELQTPRPYQIIYHIAMINGLPDNAIEDEEPLEENFLDLNAFNYGVDEPLLPGKRWPIFVFKAAKMQVRCKLEIGEVTVCLEEKNGEIPKVSELLTESQKVVRIPKEKPLETKDKRECEWRVTVTREKLDSMSKCTLSWSELEITLSSKQPTP